MNSEEEAEEDERDLHNRRGAEDEERKGDLDEEGNEHPWGKGILKKVSQSYRMTRLPFCSAEWRHWSSWCWTCEEWI